MNPLCIGGMQDHVHILLGLPPTITVSDALRRIKGASSHWIKVTFPGCLSFAWQDGYGAFAVSKSLVSEVEDYIRDNRSITGSGPSRKSTVPFWTSTGSPTTHRTCAASRAALA